MRACGGWPWFCGVCWGDKEFLGFGLQSGPMLRFLLVFLLLASCDSPSPAFRGVEATRIEVDSTRFVVRWFGARAEVLRLNTDWSPRIGEIATQAEEAVETVSGCQAERIYGDVAKLTALLDCARSPDPNHAAEWRRMPRQFGDCEASGATDMVLRLECWRL